MLAFETNYQQLLSEIEKFGVVKENRTGTNTLSLFNKSLSTFDMLEEGYLPLPTCRFYSFKIALTELFWVLGIFQNQNPIEGLDRNNVEYLCREGCKFWNAWADENGDLGPVYGAQLMEWQSKNGPINQIQNIIDKLRKNPDDRRLVCSMWNVGELDSMKLPPCYHTFEFYSEPQKGHLRKLHCRVIHRSADLPIGVPIDITVFSLLTFMLSIMTGHNVGTVTLLMGDTHIYVNQLEAVKKMLEPRIIIPYPPKLLYTGPRYVENLNDFKKEWFDIINYENIQRIPIPVSV